MSVDVCALDCDFYVFSGHKVYGPTGIGVLYGKAELLEAMPPYQGGGDMISSVTFEKTIYNRLPYKFEAGTPHISGAIGLGAALEYVYSLGIDRIARHEQQVLAYGTKRLLEIPGLLPTPALGAVVRAVRTAFSRRLAARLARWWLASAVTASPAIMTITPATGRIAARAIDGLVNLSIIRCSEAGNLISPGLR